MCEVARDVAPSENSETDEYDGSHEAEDHQHAAIRWISRGCRVKLPHPIAEPWRGDAFLFDSSGNDRYIPARCSACERAPTEAFMTTLPVAIPRRPNRPIGARVAAALVTALLGAPATSVFAAASSPTVEGPVTGGNGSPFVAGTTFDLAMVGYSQAEYFISGTASAYTSAGTFATDGKWAAAPASTAPYKTRILVYRPTDPKKFHGTVVVEWLNVSGGLDSAPDWISAHTELIREGITWIGVSAQFTGVEGGGSIIGLPSVGLKQVDPVRYGSLSHPGDSFSYDIFSQAGQAISHPTGVDPLGGLHLKKMIAAGESQSAFRLVTYIDAIHPLVEVYDGFFVHSRGHGGTALSQDPQPNVPVPAPAEFRSDLKVPVFVFETETDLVLLGYFPDRQDDTKLFRTWEVAGTAHADTYTLGAGFGDLGDSPSAANIVVTSSPLPGIIDCAKPINSGPQHWVLDAAFAAMNRWVRHGRPPRHAPRLDVAGSPPAIMLDKNGNALGGIRTPWVDAPIAALSGTGQSGSGFCFIFGTTVPFDATTLHALYSDHDAYVAAVKKSTQRALHKGFLVREDAKLIEANAVASSVPN
jgi:hypothetical protein